MYKLSIFLGVFAVSTMFSVYSEEGLFKKYKCQGHSKSDLYNEIMNQMKFKILEKLPEGKKAKGKMIYYSKLDESNGSVLMVLDEEIKIYFDVKRN